jgi:hypothetical protein
MGSPRVSAWGVRGGEAPGSIRGMSEQGFTTEDAEDTEVKSCRFSGLNLRVLGVLRGGIRMTH